MDGQNYVVFHNDGNDSYMNSTKNFRGADVGTTFIDLYFASATIGSAASGHDKVRLTVTAAKEELALEDVGAALAGAKDPVMIIADDVNSKYISDHVTAVASITLATQGTMLTTEAVTVAKVLTASDSGKTFMMSSAAGAYEVTLPVAANLVAGTHYKFVTLEDTPTADITIAAGSAIIDFVVNDSQGDAGPSTAGTAVSNILIEAASKQGDHLDVMCDGTTWYFEAHSAVSNGFTTS